MELEEHILVSASGEYQRKVWLRRDSRGSSSTLGVILDAEYYLEKMSALAVLKQRESSDASPRVTWLFVSNLENAARHADYICNARYAAFIARDVVAWCQRRDPALAPGGHLICGLSLSGLAAAHLVLSHPAVFDAAVCQSGSFWWNEEWLTRQVAAEPNEPKRFWISVGAREHGAGLSHAPSGMYQGVAQEAACLRFHEALKRKGHDSHFHAFDGGHDTKCWSSELPAALEWLTSLAK
jgi:enterochelin esterase family protein